MCARSSWFRHSEIRSRLISGDLKASDFVTRIVEIGGTASTSCNSGRYTPNMWVPPIIGPALIEAETRKQFGEIRSRNPAPERDGPPADVTTGALPKRHRSRHPAASHGFRA